MVQHFARTDFSRVKKSFEINKSRLDTLLLVFVLTQQSLKDLVQILGNSWYECGIQPYAS